MTWTVLVSDCISVQLCSLLWTCICCVIVWYLFWGLRTSWGRLCAFFLPSSAFIGCQGHEGGLGVRLLILVYVRAMSLWATVDRPRGPVTAGVLFVSCGPLLTQTALLWEASCCDSLWHMHAHIHAHKPWSHVARSVGAVQPGHSRGHLPFREGEGSNIWYLNYVHKSSSVCCVWWQ